MVTYKDIRNNSDILAYISKADETLLALGYTEHGLAHLGKCVHDSEWILTQLGYDERTIELAKIAAFMHDMGNMVNRSGHAHHGALMAFQILDKLGMSADEIAIVACAIGHHDEGTAYPIDAVTNALIIADKSDVRRTRVREFRPEQKDIHDSVNYAVEKSHMEFSKEEKKISLVLEVDTKISTVADYFEIFLNRMLLCKKAAAFFDLEFKLIINGTEII